jgi:hypothetical protein
MQGALDIGEVTFARVSDAQVVIDLYTDSFVRAFDTFAQCDALAHVAYNHLGWGSEAFDSLMGALRFMEEHCRPLDAQGSPVKAMCADRTRAHPRPPSPF